MTDGCSVESLGGNVSEGCSADDYAEIPVDTQSDNSTAGITQLDSLVTPEENNNDTDTPSDSGVTNILDLQ